jgi:UPF0755 protein
MSKFVPYLIIFAIVVGGLGYFGYTTYQRFYFPPSNAPTGEYVFEVEEGDTFRDIAADLEQDNVAYEFALLFHSNQIAVKDLQIGTYSLDLDNTGPEDIITQINDETDRIAELIAANSQPTEMITFREGLRLEQVITLLDEAEIAPAQQLRDYARDPKNFDRETYPFLPEPLTCTYGDQNNCALYYIEGYAYPDTYEFFLPSTPEQVFTKFLNNFERKVWDQIETKPDSDTFEKAIIMASVVERESGRPANGVSAANLEEVNEERANIAAAFYNRLDRGMMWQSDPTIPYPSGKEVCQQTFELEGCIFLDSPEADNLYNTYRISGYPIGPITSPQWDNVNAVLNPANVDYLFFTSDISGKKYFASTDSGHTANIARMKDINAELEAQAQ